MRNFLELYFLEYFLELCTRLCHRTLYIRGELFLEPEYPGDLDDAAWECGQRGCATREVQGSA